jgi:hypothetical protein
MEDEQDAETQQTLAPIEKADKLIRLSDEYSLMKNAGRTDIPFYLIPSLDSFVIDLTGYEFVLPSPAFDYIGSGINYPEMIGGSWAYVSILYNDTSEIRYAKLKKSDDGNTLTLTNVGNELAGKNVSEFVLAFRFYIDNDKGEQEIDHFKVRVE